MGGLLRFDDVETSRLRELLREAPATVTEQSSDEGPTLTDMLSLADSLGGTLGGFLSSEERPDIVFFCDTLFVAGNTNRGAIDDLDANEVIEIPDGRLRIWWD